MEEGLRGKGQRGGRKKGEGRYCRQSNKEECGGKGGVREEERAGGGEGGQGESEEENARKGTTSSHYQAQPAPTPMPPALPSRPLGSALTPPSDLQ